MGLRISEVGQSPSATAEANIQNDRLADPKDSARANKDSFDSSKVTQELYDLINSKWCPTFNR